MTPFLTPFFCQFYLTALKTRWGSNWDMSGASPTTKARRARRARRQWHLRRQIRQSFDEGQNQGGGFHRSVHLQKGDLFWGDFAWYFGRKYVKFVFSFMLTCVYKYILSETIGICTLHRYLYIYINI